MNNPLPIEWIAFDADDTLWHNETLYRDAKLRLAEILSVYGTLEQVETALEATEGRNVSTFGFGIKSFVLSMIETAVALSGGEIRGREIQKVIDLGRQMIPNEMQVLEGVEPALADLSARYSLMLITKGDLMDQEIKLARSGLAKYFQVVEIVADKGPEAYRKILARVGVQPEQFVMVGNSLKSDILPVVQIGGHAVYIPYDLTWVHELHAEGLEEGAYAEIASMTELPWLIERMNDARGKIRPQD